MLKGKQSYLKGAFIISMGGMLSKALGALYRIPLTALLGAEGIGLYQMAYPLYCMLLTLSASGLPTAVSRLISCNKQSNVTKSAFKLYLVIGAIGSIIMYLLATPIARLYGESSLTLGCKLLAPSVFFVCILSVVRGYFQGLGNMYPTALTEVLEQVIKVLVGTLLAYCFRSNLSLAVAFSLLAVSISEGICALLSIIMYSRRRDNYSDLKPIPYRRILSYTLPLSLTALATPITQLIEGVVCVRLLKMITPQANALYGLYSGCAITLVNLPVSLSYGLAVAGIPRISPIFESGNIKQAKSKVYNSLLLTFLLSFVCAVALFIFCPIAIKILFRSLDDEYRQLLINLTRFISINAVTSSLVQTSSACLTALSRPRLASISQWVSGIVRVIMSAILIYYTRLGIFGVAISSLIAYFVAIFLNICYIIRVKSTKTGAKL